MRGASVSSCVVLWLFCVWGAAEGLTRMVGCLPTLRCGPLQLHTTRTDLWAPVQKESRTVRHVSFAFRGSRGGGLSVSARASPALLNVSAQRTSTEAQPPS